MWALPTTAVAAAQAGDAPAGIPPLCSWTLMGARFLIRSNPSHLGATVVEGTHFRHHLPNPGMDHAPRHRASSGLTSPLRMTKGFRCVLTSMWRERVRYFPGESGDALMASLSWFLQSGPNAGLQCRKRHVVCHCRSKCGGQGRWDLYRL